LCCSAIDDNHKLNLLIVKTEKVSSYITTSDKDLIINKILLGLILLASLPAYAEEFPAGLRLPTEQELSKEPLRKKSPTKNATISADFNGDGKLDHAFLLAGIKKQKGALAVKLSNGNAYKWFILDKELDWDSTQMSLELAKPNRKYETACGKGYWECSANEPKSITLKNTGFWYAPFEQRGAVIIFWNKTKNDFESVTMND
jgi:hypothetical protein